MDEFFSAATFEDMNILSPIMEEDGGDAGGVTNGDSSPPPPQSLLLEEVAAPVVPPPQSGISFMPGGSPGRSAGHRRAQSEIIGLVPGGDLDFAVQGDGDMAPLLEGESMEDYFSMFAGVESVNSACVGSPSSMAKAGALPPRAPRHQHSHSTDLSSSMAGARAGALPPMAPRHQRSHSMDVPSSSMASEPGAGALPARAPAPGHQLSYSMDVASSPMAEWPGAGALPPRAPRHQHSHSMDPSSFMAGARAGALPPRAPRHQRSHSMDVPSPSSSMAAGAEAGALPPGHQLSYSMDVPSSSMGAGALPPRVPALGHQLNYSMDVPSSSMATAGSGSEAPPPRAPTTPMSHQRSNSTDLPSCSRQAWQLLEAAEAAGWRPTWERKAMPVAELQQLALVDPKRVQKILSNRESAARSKQRRAQYIAELQNKVNALKQEVAEITAQSTEFKSNKDLLIAENSELKMKLQNVEISRQLKSAVNDVMLREILQLKIEAGEIDNDGMALIFNGLPQPFGGEQQMLNQNQAMHPLEGMQLMQMSPPLQQMPQDLQHFQQQSLHPVPMEDQLLQQASPNLEMDEPMLDGLSHYQAGEGGPDNGDS